MSSTFKSTLSWVVAVAIVGWACGAPCYANLIQNGSFETNTVGVLNSEQTINVGTPSAQLANWNVYSDAPVIGYLDGTVEHGMSAKDGSYFLNIGPNGNPSTRYVTQAFAVTANTTYNVSYWEAQRDATSSWQDTTLTAATGTLSGTNGNLVNWSAPGNTNVLSGTANGAQNTWTLFTYTFVPSASTTVTMLFTENQTHYSTSGTFLDLLDVTAIPEPGTLTLLAGGMAGLLCYAWRKRR